MRNDAQLLATSELSYLDASKVSSPAGALSELDVLSAEGRRLGSIEGVVIDAAARRVRYLSVRSSGWLGRRRYLVAADELLRSRASARRFVSAWISARQPCPVSTPRSSTSFLTTICWPPGSRCAPHKRPVIPHRPSNPPVNACSPHNVSSDRASRGRAAPSKLRMGWVTGFEPATS